MSDFENEDVLNGEVIQVNEERGMLVVSHEDGYSAIELLGEYLVEVGDELKGKLVCEGDEVVINLTKDAKMDVCVEGTWDELAVAREHAFL